MTIIMNDANYSGELLYIYLFVGFSPETVILCNCNSAPPMQCNWFEFPPAQVPQHWIPHKLWIEMQWHLHSPMLQCSPTMVTDQSMILFTLLVSLNPCRVFIEHETMKIGLTWSIRVRYVLTWSFSASLDQSWSVENSGQPPKLNVRCDQSQINVDPTIQLLK